jgi:co-chaperonin GroES (HSP10)
MILPDKDKIFIPANNVMIRLDISYKDLLNNRRKIALGSVSVFLNTSYQPVDHCPRTGVIYKLPNELIYDEQNPSNGLPWKTDNELQEGDRVWFVYLPAKMALGGLIDESLGGTGRWFRDKNDESVVYILMRYDSLVLAKRDDKYFCVNGNIILEPVKYQMVSKVGLKLPEYEKMDCIVRCIGKPNKAYVDNSVEAEDISVGDTVIIRKWKIRLDDQIITSIGKDLNTNSKSLIYLQRKMIYAKVI